MGPMTSDQAQQKYQCTKCVEEGGGSCGANDEGIGSFDCVLDRTCSVRCKHCNQIVYFGGNMQDQRKVFICPYDGCGKKQHNPYLGETYTIALKHDNTPDMRRKPFYFVESRYGEAHSENMTYNQMAMVRKALRDLGILVVDHITENHMR